MAALGQCMVARQYSGKAMVRQQIEPGHLPKVRDQLGKEVAPHRDAQNYLTHLDEKRFLRSQPGMKMQELQQ